MLSRPLFQVKIPQPEAIFLKPRLPALSCQSPFIPLLYINISYRDLLPAILRIANNGFSPAIMILSGRLTATKLPIIHRARPQFWALPAVTTARLKL